MCVGGGGGYMYMQYLSQNREIHIIIMCIVFNTSMGTNTQTCWVIENHFSQSDLLLWRSGQCIVILLICLYIEEHSLFTVITDDMHTCIYLTYSTSKEQLTIHSAYCTPPPPKVNNSTKTSQPTTTNKNSS